MLKVSPLVCRPSLMRPNESMTLRAPLDFIPIRSKRIIDIDDGPIAADLDLAFVDGRCLSRIRAVPNGLRIKFGSLAIAGTSLAHQNTD